MATRPTGYWHRAVSPSNVAEAIGQLDASDLPNLTVAMHPGYIAGNWYLPYGASVAAGSALSAASVRLAPWLVPAPITISDIGVRITTLAAGGALMLAIYANNPATGRPTGAALATSGAISTAATGILTVTLAAPITLQPGTYWIAAQADATAGSVVICQTYIGSQGVFGSLIGDATVGNISNSATAAATLLSVTNTYGTFPDMTGATFALATTTGTVLLYFKAA